MAVSWGQAPGSRVQGYRDGRSRWLGENERGSLESFELQTWKVKEDLDGVPEGCTQTA